MFSSLAVPFPNVISIMLVAPVVMKPHQLGAVREHTDFTHPQSLLCVYKSCSGTAGKQDQ